MAIGLIRRRREEIKQRDRNVCREKKRRQKKKKEKEVREKGELTKKFLKMSLWTTVSEVEEGLAQLRSAKQKCDALKLQIKFRKKVLNQTHPDKTIFFFSHQRKQHAHIELKKNLLKLLSRPELQPLLSREQLAHDPELLIKFYRRIEHQFSIDDGLVWFKGTILGYNKESGEFRVMYDDEDKEYLYPLLEHLAKGEVHVIDQ